MVGNHELFNFLSLTDSSIPQGAKQDNYFINNFKRKIVALLYYKFWRINNIFLRKKIIGQSTLI